MTTDTLDQLKSKKIKAVFFDMDGILFDSMPYHAEAWHRAMADFGFEFSLHEAYLHEGRTGDSTIDAVYRKKYGHSASRQTKDEIYALKATYFHQYPEAEQIPDVLEVLRFVKAQGVEIMVVTGSAQTSLLERLQGNFPDIFEEGKIISAFDVEHGKPDPEPYLMALERAGVKANEALVVENAPLGVRAGVAAEIFTIAVNTGILTVDDLKEAGADVVFGNMKQLKEFLGELVFVKKGM